jgi:hypothetical protein
MIRPSLHRLRAAVLTLGLSLPLIASAHPGHYHPPGEEDEFDAFRAMRSNWLHLHGNLEITCAFVALASLVVIRLCSQKKVRIAAALVLGTSLTLIAAH